MKNHLAAVSRNKIAATITNNSIAQVFQSQARRVGLNVIILLLQTNDVGGLSGSFRPVSINVTRPGSIDTDLGNYIQILFA